MLFSNEIPLFLVKEKKSTIISITLVGGHEGILLAYKCMKSLRAPTVDMGYVPNAKYLAHISHQTQKIAP